MGSLQNGVYCTVKIDYLKGRFPALGELKWNHLVRLIKILENIYLDGGSFLERTGTGGLCRISMGPHSHMFHLGYCYLGSKEMEKKFGPGVFNDLLDQLGCLEVAEPYKPGVWTKGYRLTEEWREAFDELFKIIEDGPVSGARLVDKSGKTVARRAKNNNAIRSRDKNGNNAKTNAFVPFSIPVNQTCLRESFNYVKGLHDSIGGAETPGMGRQHRERVGRMYDGLWDIYHLSYSDLIMGEVPQVYVESNSGRLYGQGLTLQGVIREVKYAALAGMPVRELDISNCHYTILYQMARESGEDCRGIKSYMDNKSFFRDQITDDVFGGEIKRGEISREDATGLIKECLISIVNGARHSVKQFECSPNSIKEFSLPKTLRFHGAFDGVQKAKRLVRHGLFRLVADDITKATRAIINSQDLVRARGGASVYINAMGKSIDQTEGRAKIISHLIRGVEAKILNIVLEEYPGKIWVPMHDGFTIESGIDPRKIEEKIREGTGYDIRLKEEVNYEGLNTESIKERIVGRCLPKRKNQRRNQPVQSRAL